MHLWRKLDAKDRWKYWHGLAEGSMQKEASIEVGLSIIMGMRDTLSKKVCDSSIIEDMGALIVNAELQIYLADVGHY